MLKVFPPQSSPTEAKIESFSDLPKGWHFGEELAPSKEVIEKSLKIEEAASLYGYETDAFPGIDGEIMVTVYHGNHSLEFTVENDSSIIFALEENDNEIDYKELLSFEDAMIELDRYNKLSGHKWNILESSAYTILIEKDENLPAWLLKIPQIRESQLFPESVSANREIEYIPTSIDSTGESLLIPLSSGSSPSMNYRINAA